MSWRHYLDSVMRMTKQSLAALDAAVMPVRCVFCGVDCIAGEVICCNGCASDLPWNVDCCPRCAEPAITPQARGVVCAPCQLQPPAFTQATAPLIYSFPVAASIKALKFKRRLEYAEAMGQLLLQVALGSERDVDAILPVPLHWRRQALRGFNQSAELARPLLKKMRWPVIRNVRRVRPTPYQSGLVAEERTRNLRNAFSVDGHIAARHVLIVDDVITTGTTCDRLARVLLAAGAQKVSVLAVARAARWGQTGLKV